MQLVNPYHGPEAWSHFVAVLSHHVVSGKPGPKAASRDEQCEQNVLLAI